MKLRRYLAVFTAVAAVAGMVFFALRKPAAPAPGPRISISRTRIFFPYFKVNGAPIGHLLLDTGSDAILLLGAEAQRLGLKETSPANAAGADAVHAPALSDPVYFTVADRTMLGQLEIIDLPSTGLDGILGWPGIRDNILLFDSTNRTVSALAKLPDDLSGWLKLKILPGGILALQMPLPGGLSGTLLIDTGAPTGVLLPPDQWAAWKTAHPDALVQSLPYDGPEIGSGTTEEAWADGVAIGSLTLHDVPVCESPPAQSARFGNFAGELGLFALDRMDLILDAKNGCAYLKPAPSDEPSASATIPENRNFTFNLWRLLGDNDWAVTENVRVRAGYVYLLSADVKMKALDYAGAIADSQQALALDPHDAEARIFLATIRLQNGDTAGALADYSKAIDDASANPVAYYRRGLAREMQGDFEGALADFTKAVGLDPANAFNSRLHQHCLLLRLGRPDADFGKSVAGWRNDWNKAVGGFLAGDIDELEFQSAAARGNASAIAHQQCEADYYLGLAHLLKGDRAGARAFWQKALALPGGGFDENQLSARAELARLSPPQ